MIDLSKKQQIESKFTKYEIARILGARALQIAMNAPVLLKIEKKDFESMNYDPLKIAEVELYAGVLPITVKRPMPQKSADKLTKIIAKEVPKEAPKEKAPEKKEEKSEEKESKEEEIIKEVEGTEVMELATPEDEVEEETGGDEELE